MPSGSRTYFLTYAALVLLLAGTVSVSLFHLGIWNPILNLSIAVAKASLIVWFFMHVRQGQPIARLFTAAAFFWLLLLFGLPLTDYLAR